MMSNLFSSFDPSSNLHSYSNWISSFIGLMIFIPVYWILPNRSSIILNNLLEILHNEFKTLLGPSSFKGSTLMFISLLTTIIFNNFMGLFPYIFTSTSHLSMTLSLAIPMWLSFMFFGWFNYSKYMFAHMVPQSTPSVLMPFMVLIETVSNIIRPGTLAVRLAANMIAGHLLMTLLGNQTSSSSSFILVTLLMVQVLLLSLECAVACIQAYVFAVLSSLYSSEITQH